jgi:hypothetical protein
MHRSTSSLLSLCLLGGTCSAWSLGEADFASRLARQSMEAAQRPAGQKALLSTRAEGPVLELRAGLARDRAEGGATATSTPLALSYQPSATSPWTFEVSGAGYTRATTPHGPAVDGLADVSVDVSRSLPGSFIAVLGVTVPTGGEVGSTTASQHLSLLRIGGLGKDWSYLWLTDVQRSNRRDEGLARTAQTLYGEADYDAGEGRTLFFSAVRWHRRGAGGVTDLGVGYTFPVAASSLATLGLSRGISQDAKHTGLSFKVKHSF